MLYIIINMLFEYLHVFVNKNAQWKILGISSAKGFTKGFSFVNFFSWLAGYRIGHCSPILWILWFMIAKNLSSSLYLLLYFLKLLQNLPLYLSLWCLRASVCVFHKLINSIAGIWQWIEQNTKTSQTGFAIVVTK